MRSAAIALLLACSTAHAAPVESTTVLVRVAVAEARWTRPIDHSGMWWILQRYAHTRHISIARAADIRVWRWSRPPLWVSQVQPGCREPQFWPSGLNWGRHRPYCLELYAQAVAFLRGRVADPCRGQARGWRTQGPALLKALSLGRKQVWCGPTAVAFVR